MMTKKRKFIIAFLTGLVLGIIFGLLFANGYSKHKTRSIVEKMNERCPIYTAQTDKIRIDSVVFKNDTLNLNYTLTDSITEVEHFRYSLLGVEVLFFSDFTDEEKEILNKNVYKECIFWQGNLTRVIIHSSKTN
ncbi:MAG: hypothetical protein LBN27_13225 [Prevotellaceae bacterium]|jgi:hypothetical protein|nr:hypothetical protein [Prevotellaceae bacterium]